MSIFTLIHLSRERTIVGLYINNGGLTVFAKWTSHFLETGDRIRVFFILLEKNKV